MKRFLDCETIIKNSNIPLKENRSEIVFENPKRLEVCVIKVDGCAITDGIRCDYALTAESVKEEFHIELKGCDVKHAFDQLEATIKKISSNPQNTPKLCFIISTRCPLSSIEIQGRQKKMKKKYNAKLIVKNTPHIYTIETA